MENENVTIKQGISNGWLVFIIVMVLIGGTALGYWLSSRNKTEEKVAVSPTPSASTTPSKTASTSPTPSSSSDWKVFTNNKYGFSLTLTDNWQGYRYEEQAPNDGSATMWFRFYVPTSDPNYASGAMPGYDNPFVISVYTKAQWDAVDKNGPHDTYVTENDKYVIAFSRWQACATDLCNKITNDDLVKIKNSIVAE